MMFSEEVPLHSESLIHQNCCSLCSASGGKPRQQADRKGALTGSAKSHNPLYMPLYLWSNRDTTGEQVIGQRWQMWKFPCTVMESSVKRTREKTTIEG